MEFPKLALNGSRATFRIVVSLFFSSKSRTITHGVPQGSILGPILFSIYINDLPGIPNSSSLESYQEDSKLFLSFVVKEIGDAVKRLNEDIRMVASWCCNHSLLINPEKTNLLVMGTHQLLSTLPEDFHITLLGNEIYPPSLAKDFGIILDKTLTYDDNITEVVSKCVAPLCQIDRLKHLLETKTMLLRLKLSYLVNYFIVRHFVRTLLKRA